MKKVFISVPMKGRTDTAIINSINAMHAIAEIMVGESLQPVYMFDQTVDQNVLAGSLYYLGETIKTMGSCDYVIRINDDWKFDNCHIVRTAAEAYGIPTLVVDMRNIKAFNDLYNFEGEEDI